MDFIVAEDKHGKEVKASYSITSAASATAPLTNVEIMVKYSKQNACTRFIIYDCEEGQRVTVKGSQGTFTYEPKDNDTIGFLCAGVGFNPIMSMIRTIMATKVKMKAYIFYMV